jgi:outer membrane murein-binding lipoprotein Lpp
MKRRRIVGLASIALLAGCSDRASLDELTKPELNGEVSPGLGTTDVVIETTIETPDGCVHAIDVAERIFDIAAAGFGAASDGFGAAADLDLDGLAAAAVGMSDANDDMTEIRPEWQAAKSDCLNP